MNPFYLLLRGAAAGAAGAGVLALCACSGAASVAQTPILPAAAGPGAAAEPATSSAFVRAVHGSPDAGPVDIYVYPDGTKRPSTPAVGDAEYPQITGYLSVPAGKYKVDVVAPAGAPPNTKAVASEVVGVKGNVQYSIVVGGEVGNGSLRFVNFVEPGEMSGQTALIVHHASPFVQKALGGPVGVGVYDASMAPPKSIPQLFAFSLSNKTSGPAKSGMVDRGEYFLSPLPPSLPQEVGFAAGAPAGSGDFTTLVTATPSQLAKGLKHKTKAEKELAADTSSQIPAGAHLSIFAVDTTSAAQLIGTLDP